MEQPRYLKCRGCFVYISYKKAREAIKEWVALKSCCYCGKASVNQIIDKLQSLTCLGQFCNGITQ